MSEFQFYEFARVDKPLSQAEKAEISSWSSRTEASNYGAVFTYSYSDFPKDEEEVVLHYFDAMYYWANWGSVKFMLKFPRELINYQQVLPYDITDEYIEGGVEVTRTKEWVIIKISYHSDEGYLDWDETNGVLDNLLPIRQQILAGDYRALYLAWLHFASMIWHDGDFSDETEYEFENGIEVEIEEIMEPPLPPNLQKPERCLEELIAVLGINEKLINRVANDSAFEEVSEPDYFALLAHLSLSEKDEILREVMKGTPNMGIHLKKKLMKFSSEPAKAEVPPRRTLRQMARFYGDI